MHHKKKQCDTSKVTKKVKDILVKAKTYWFPPDVVVAKVVPKRTKKQKNPKGILYFLDRLISGRNNLYLPYVICIIVQTTYIYMYTIFWIRMQSSLKNEGK